MQPKLKPEAKPISKHKAKRMAKRKAKREAAQRIAELEAQSKKPWLESQLEDYLNLKNTLLGVSANANREANANMLANQLLFIQNQLADEEKNGAYDDMRTFIMRELFDIDETGVNARPGRLREFEQFWGKQFVVLGNTPTGRSLFTQIYERRYGIDPKRLQIGENNTDMNNPSTEAMHIDPDHRDKGDNFAVYDPVKDIMRPGKGDDSYVFLQDLQMSKLLYENTKGPQKYEPLVTAAHEIIHGLHNITGTDQRGKLKKQQEYKKPENDQGISLEENATTMFGMNSTEENEGYFSEMYRDADNPEAEEKARRIFKVNEQRVRVDVGMPKGDTYRIRHLDPNNFDPTFLNPPELLNAPDGEDSEDAASVPRAMRTPYITPKEYAVFEKQTRLKTLAREGLMLYSKWYKLRDSWPKEGNIYWFNQIEPLKMQYESLSKQTKDRIKEMACDPRNKRTSDVTNAYLGFMDDTKAGVEHFLRPQKPQAQKPQAQKPQAQKPKAGKPKS